MRSFWWISALCASGAATVLVCQRGDAPATGGAPSPPNAIATSSAITTSNTVATQDATLPDRFYPGFDARKDPLPPPKRGGRVVVHTEAKPDNLNRLLDNSGITHRIQSEVHATLVARDLASGDLVPELARSWTVDDTLVLKDGSSLWGKVEERGEDWFVTPLSAPGEESSAPRTIAKSACERLDRGTVFTFKLRDGVKWHDGHPLCVEDFLLTWQLSRKPKVDCDAQRFQFAHVVRAEALDAHTLRYFFDRQHYGALSTFEALIPLPAHLYDLRNRENKDFKAEASDDEEARYVNEHPCNQMWVGLGPYRVTVHNKEYLEAERFPDYFDPRAAAGSTRSAGATSTRTTSPSARCSTARSTSPRACWPRTTSVPRPARPSSSRVSTAATTTRRA
jgi:ABC-type transport system substrate-binding protein